MNLGQVTETLLPNEKSSWLASKHGLDSAQTIILDGAALGAIYPDGLAKSGTLLAKNTSTNRYVPYDQAAVTNGVNVAAGYLYRSIDIRNKTGGTFHDSAAALLEHCSVDVAKLPRTAAETGGPHAAAVTALSGRITHRS